MTPHPRSLGNVWSCLVVSAGGKGVCFWQLEVKTRRFANKAPHGLLHK